VITGGVRQQTNTLPLLNIDLGQGPTFFRSDNNPQDAQAPSQSRSVRQAIENLFAAIAREGDHIGSPNRSNSCPSVAR